MIWIFSEPPIGCGGDVIDIFPAESDEEAVRVELFDDEIEQLSFFDPLTGHVARKVPRLTVVSQNPLRHPQAHAASSGRQNQRRTQRPLGLL